MKYTQHILENNNLNEVFELVTLCIFGFVMYILTSKIFNYIPQEISHFISLKFKKAK